MRTKVIQPMQTKVNLCLYSFLWIVLLTACGGRSQTATATLQSTDLPSPTSTATPQNIFTPELLTSFNPGDVLLQKEIEPTFIRPESQYPFGRVPSFTLLADGTLIYLDEGSNYQDQDLRQIKLAPAETARVVSDILGLGLAKLESYTEKCKLQVDNSELCVEDASYTIFRGRLASGIMHQVRIYADFANYPETFQNIQSYLDDYQHPNAELFRPKAASLFFSPLQGQKSSEIIPGELLNRILPREADTRIWATYLEGEELDQLLGNLPRNMGDFVFDINGKYFDVYIVPWLPGVDYRAAIQAEFPAPTPEPSIVNKFRACPISPTEPTSITTGLLRLVYSSENKLWLWDEGQDKLALVQAEAVNQILLTKDGRTIVFTLQIGPGPGEIWAVGVDGENLRMLVGGEEIIGGVQAIEISSDGQLLTFTHKIDKNNAELWVAQMDGTGSRRLVSKEELHSIFDDYDNPQGLIPSSVRWIPGTHQVMYDAYPTGDGIFIYVQDQVWTVDADTLQKQVLLPPGLGGSITFSPDGKTMAIVSPDRLQLMEVGTNNPWLIELPYHAIGFGEYYFYPAMVWAKDSSYLLLALPYTNQGTQDEPIAIWQVPIAASSPVKLAEFSGFAPSFQFSPDLSRVAYWKAGPQSNDRDLHLANVDGSEDVHYQTSFVLDFLGWAPDSQHFAYTYGEPGTSITMIGDICSDPHKLTDYHAFPTWLGSERLLLLYDQDGRLELSLVEANGEIRLLIQPEDYDNFAYVIFQSGE